MINKDLGVAIHLPFSQVCITNQINEIEVLFSSDIIDDTFTNTISGSGRYC